MEAAAVVEKENVEAVGVLRRERKHVSADDFMRAIQQLRAEAVKNGTFGMSMEEINDVIAECRQQWQNR